MYVTFSNALCNPRLQCVPYERYDFFNNITAIKIFKWTRAELSCVRKGSDSYGVGADISLPHCLIGGGGRYLNAAKDQTRHESDAWVEIPGLVVRYNALARCLE